VAGRVARGRFVLRNLLFVATVLRMPLRFFGRLCF